MPSRPEPIERIEVRSTTFRDRPGDERGRFAERLGGISATERVLIDTCHRVELVTVDAEAAGADARLRGADAGRRVFEVVAGFDSAVIAE
ncbi:MAG TPA: hypothetical protein VLA76_12395, partial [Candidatus Angelobacter sp.]|nr:hypothetical protein [Candidatus Angelobacter sp.]